MKEIFIKKLILEKVRNLDYTEISLSENERKHLIFTGKNGSGKTTVLNGLSKMLDRLACSNNPMEANKNLPIDYYSNLGFAEEQNYSTRDIIKGMEKRIMSYQEQISEVKQSLKVDFNCSEDEFRLAFETGKFILAYYKADRVFSADLPQHVEKVELKDTYSIQETPRKNFVKYLLDLKMTQALAISGGKREKAAGIQEWFDNFEKLLQRIFENEELHLEFDEDTFKFHIEEPGKEQYDFNTLSSGYAAILDIVVDLIIRMEKHSRKKFRYDLPGIVLIDEIETHLHLELQRKILDLLTTIFPKIQFIVTTHSPFVLNSLPDVVIYDLEKKILVKNGLSDVPYDGIVEGYFKADMMSEELRTKFERYKELTEKKNLTDDDYEEITRLEMYLDEIPDYLALGITTEYQRQKLQFEEREDVDG